MQKSISLCKKPRREVCLKKKKKQPCLLLSGSFQLSGHRSLKNNLFISSRWVVALPAAGAHSSSTCSGAGPQLGPGAPVPIVALRLLAGSPDAVALEAPLRSERKKEGGKTIKKCRSKLDSAGKVQQERRGTMQR